MSSRPTVWAIVVTYRRAHTLPALLDELERQTRPPDDLTVIDNGSESGVASICRARGVRYIDAGENRGPAGGIALGMMETLRRADPDHWILLVDDDDPPEPATLFEHLVEFAEQQLRADPRTGGVGRVGSRYLRRSGRVARARDDELHGAVIVDSIGGNQFPLYRVAAVARAGVFDERLFFGFEELEFGLRMRRAGFRLYAHGELWFAARQRRGRLNLPKSQLKTPAATTAWRRYYTARNATWIARRYGRPPSALVIGTRSGVGGLVRLVQTRRPLTEAVLPIKGVRDAFVGNLGRIVDPSAAEKTH